MKKKKQQETPVSESNLDVDLKTLIHQHRLFFDKLIELIPAKFYLPVDDKEKTWFQGLRKGEKAAAKKESRENIKKARRDRLDPVNSSKSTLDLLMQNLEKEKEKEEIDDEEEVEINPMMSGLEDDEQEKSVTYEELRLRLHRKIEELQAGRNPSSSDKVKKKNNDKNKNKGNQQKKRKRESDTNKNKPATSVSTENVEKDAVEAAKELKFSHVKIEDEKHGKKKKRKFSKSKELEKAKQLEEAKNDPAKGEAIAKKHSWRAAADRAAGIKVHDDPKLLKQSVRKEKQQQRKHAEKWKDRVETQQKMKAEKQQTRSQNIADRIQQKKMRRIAKREKKLLRPGFEGRKEGYINEDAGQAA